MANEYNLCHASVQFVIRRDSKQRFRFGSLQSQAGKRVLEAHGLQGYGLREDSQQKDFQENSLSSLILLQRQKALTKSSAALTVAKYLDWP